MGRVDILFLVRTPLASSLAWDFSSAQYLVNQWLNSHQIFMDIFLEHNKGLIRFSWPWHNVQGHSSRKTENSVGVGTRLSCLHNILWTSGWIFTKCSWIYSLDITKNSLDFHDHDLIFKVTAVEKLIILWHFLVCTISFEPVVGFLQNFHGYIIGT